MSQLVEFECNCENITIDCLGDVTQCHGLGERGVESQSIMTSEETRDLSLKPDGSKMKSKTKKVETCNK